MTENLAPVIEKLNAHAASITEKIWKLSAPTVGQGLKEDGTYRSRKLHGTEEFFFKGVRAGARGLVIEFTPVDAADYTQLEFAQGKAIDAFGEEFEKELIAALGSNAKTFNNAVNSVVTRARREAGIVPEPRHKDEYDANEHWGSF